MYFVNNKKMVTGKCILWNLLSMKLQMATTKRTSPYWTQKIAALLYDHVTFYVTDDIGNIFLKVQSSSGNTKAKDEKTKVQ